MMTFGPEIDAAISAGVVLPREFLEIWARIRDTGAFHKERLWSDTYDVTAEVTDPETGLGVAHAWQGASGLVDIDAIPRVANMTVPRIGIQMVAMGPTITRILQTYDARQAPVFIWRGWQERRSRRLVAPAVLRFVGFIDTVDPVIAPEGGESVVRLECVSHSQEMTRASSDTRSDESQQRRSPGDTFFEGAATVGDQTFFWGGEVGKVDTVAPVKAPDRVVNP